MRKLLILTLLFLAACGGRTETVTTGAITCTAAYRASTSQPLEREETIRFTDTDAEQSILFTDLVFHAAYDAGGADNERNMRLWVTDVDETIIYQTQLYQFELNRGPQNQFVGGHGFTGLNYNYHPDSAAELQFWCQAEQSPE